MMNSVEELMVLLEVVVVDVCKFYVILMLCMSWLLCCLNDLVNI